MATWNHNRAHFRIEYPPRLRPTFVPERDAVVHPVVDCSERGFRFDAQTMKAVFSRKGTAIRGELRFPTGVSAPVAGVVVRVQSGEVAVHLTEISIPFRVILGEQVFLRQRFPSRAA
jgi:hypothetical protein